MATPRLDAEDLQRLIRDWPRAQALVSSHTAASKSSRRPLAARTQTPRLDGGELDIELRDGATAHLRPIRPDDQDAVLAFLRSMSPDSLYLRAHGIANIEKLAAWAVDTDKYDRYGIVATAGPDQSIVAHAAYIRTSDHRAEVAFEVADQLQGHGIGTMMLYDLAWVARQHDITELVALVMTTNYKMLDVVRTSGFQAKTVTDGTLTKVTMSTWPPTKETRDRTLSFRG